MNFNLHPAKPGKRTRKSRAMDRDIKALKGAARALNGCTSRRTLNAALSFLVDYYITHPSPQLPAHLNPNAR